MSDAAGPWTVLRLIDWTKDYFARSGVEEPRLSAEMLLADVLTCPRINLYAQFARVVGPDGLARYRDYVRRAASGEPISYILGRREFYSLSIKVTRDTLIPRPETELLVDVALECARTRGARRLWDVCTGSGCVAVAAARYAPALEVLATDVSEAALAVAAANAASHGVAQRVRTLRADLLDLPAEAAQAGPFDVITANPPYVSEAEMAELPANVRAEPRIALCAGPTGLEMIERIVSAAPAHLAPGGTLAAEIGLGQADRVYALLRDDGRYEGVRFLRDPAGIDRTAVARRKG